MTQLLSTIGEQDGHPATVDPEPSHYLEHLQSTVQQALSCLCCDRNTDYTPFGTLAGGLGFLCDHFLLLY
jgi:hypothetical protein